MRRDCEIAKSNVQLRRMSDVVPRRRGQRQEFPNMSNSAGLASLFTEEFGPTGCVGGCCTCTSGQSGTYCCYGDIA